MSLLLHTIFLRSWAPLAASLPVKGVASSGHNGF